MTRLPYIVFVLVFLVAVAATTASGEIVKVTGDKAHIYNPETKQVKAYDAKGKRFMVYGWQSDWYLVEAKLKHEKKLVWLSMADVEVDWAENATTALVAAVPNTNTLKLDDGTWVQYAGIQVTRKDSPLTRQTLAWLKQLLEGKQVTLEYDKKFRKNQHGYTLAYVYIDGVFVNRALVNCGVAAVLTSYKTGGGRYAGMLSYYETQARETGQGVWAAKKAAEAAETAAASTTVDSATPTQQQDRTRPLTQAERIQWNLRLTVEVRVSSERIKTDEDKDDEEVCLLGPSVPASGGGPPPEAGGTIETAG